MKIDRWNKGLLIIVLGISLIFMLNHLGQFMSVDEPKWFYKRVPQFGHAIITFNLGGTYINDKPGILPAAISGIEHLFINHSNFQPNRNPVEESFEKVLFFWRLPIVIFNIIIIAIIYLLLKDLFDPDFAILFISFIAINPIIIGISQIVNPDATLWSTGFVSILAFFLYLKTNFKKYLYISGFFLGLALLSKYFATLIYILLIISIVIEYLIDDNLNIKHLLRRLFDFSLLVGISMMVYTIFFPATWINPLLIFKGTILSGILKPAYFIIIPGLFFLFCDVFFWKGRFLNFFRQKKILHLVIRLISLITVIYSGYLLLNLFSNYSFFDLNEFMCCYNFNEFSRSDILNASAYITIMTLTPTLFLVLLIFVVSISIKGSNFLKSCNLNQINLIYSVIFFIILYFLGSSLSRNTVIPRYQVILYPMYSLIASVVIISLIKKKNILQLITILIVILNIFVVFQSSPFYLQYENTLNVHNAVISEAWGYGGYELAQEINKISNAKNISIWVDREGFNEFFLGNGYFRSSSNPFKNENIDYLVLTWGGKRILNRELKDHEFDESMDDFQLNYSMGNVLLNYYDKDPLYQITINNNPNNYIKLVKVDSVDKIK